MPHTIRERRKILSRIHRLHGQLTAVEKALEKEDECYKVLQLLSSCRGALNGLMGDILEGHIEEHIVAPENRKVASVAGKEVIDILKSFWR